MSLRLRTRFCSFKSGHYLQSVLLWFFCCLTFGDVAQAEDQFQTRQIKRSAVIKLSPSEYADMTGQSAALALVLDHLTFGPFPKSSPLSSQTIPTLVSLLVADETVSTSLVAGTLEAMGWSPKTRAEKASYHLALGQWTKVRQSAPTASPITDQQEEKANTFEGPIQFGTSITVPLRMLLPRLTFSENKNEIGASIYLPGYNALSGKFRFSLDILDEQQKLVGKKEDVFEAKADWSSMVGYPVPHNSRLSFPLKNGDRPTRFRIRGERFYNGMAKPFARENPSSSGIQESLQFDIPIILDANAITGAKSNDMPPTTTTTPLSWIIFRETPSGIAVKMKATLPIAAASSIYLSLTDEEGHTMGPKLDVGKRTSASPDREKPIWDKYSVHAVFSPQESFAKAVGFLLEIF